MYKQYVNLRSLALSFHKLYYRNGQHGVICKYAKNPLENRTQLKSLIEITKSKGPCGTPHHISITKFSHRHVFINCAIVSSNITLLLLCGWASFVLECVLQSLHDMPITFQETNR